MYTHTRLHIVFVNDSINNLWIFSNGVDRGHHGDSITLILFKEQRKKKILYMCHQERWIRCKTISRCLDTVIFLSWFITYIRVRFSWQNNIIRSHAHARKAINKHPYTPITQRICCYIFCFILLWQSLLAFKKINIEKSIRLLEIDFFARQFFIDLVNIIIVYSYFLHLLLIKYIIFYFFISCTVNNYEKLSIMY